MHPLRINLYQSISAPIIYHRVSLVFANVTLRYGGGSSSAFSTGPSAQTQATTRVPASTSSTFHTSLAGAPLKWMWKLGGHYTYNEPFFFFEGGAARTTLQYPPTGRTRQWQLAGSPEHQRGKTASCGPLTDWGTRAQHTYNCFNLIEVPPLHRLFEQFLVFPRAPSLRRGTSRLPRRRCSPSPPRRTPPTYFICYLLSFASFLCFYACPPHQYLTSSYVFTLSSNTSGSRLLIMLTLYYDSLLTATTCLLRSTLYAFTPIPPCSPSTTIL